MSYVSPQNSLFKVVKRNLYQHLEDRVLEAKQNHQEFTRPIVTDSDIQVTIDVMQQRRHNEKAEVPIIMGKIGYGKAQFLNGFLDQLDFKEFLKTPITLRNSDQDEFLKDVKALMKVPPERRQALLDVIRTVLPKVEGLNMKTAFVNAIDGGETSDFLTFTDVADELAEVE